MARSCAREEFCAGQEVSVPQGLLASPDGTMVDFDRLLSRPE